MRGTAFLRKKETRSFIVRRTDEEKVRHEFQKIKKKKFLRGTLKSKKLKMKQQNLPKMQYYWPSRDFWWVPLQLSSVNDHSFLTQFSPIFESFIFHLNAFCCTNKNRKSQFFEEQFFFFLSSSATQKIYFQLNFQAFFYYFSLTL